MAAMIWDNESQAFKEANVPMKYDPTAGAWTDTTGLAWDPEAQSWTEKWGTQVSAYVYGAVSETITIRKNGIIVATVQTDSSGKSTEQIALSCGTYTMTGDVSGQSFIRPVTSDTKEVKVMPENCFYWYGNQCTWITGGWEDSQYYWNTNSNIPSSMLYETNCMHIKDVFRLAITKNIIDTTGFTYVKSIIQNISYYTSSNPHGTMVGLSIRHNGMGNDIKNVFISGNIVYPSTDIELISISDIPKLNDRYLTVQNNGSVSESKLFALWFE